MRIALPFTFALCFCRLFFFNHRLSCSQTRYRHTVGRSADVVHSSLMAELHAVCIAAMLPANPDLQFWTGLTALFNSPPHQHSYTLSIQRLERISSKDPGLFLVYIVRQEASRVVSGQPHGGLRQVAGAERKELSNLSTLIRQQCRPRQLDHRSHKIRQLQSRLTDQLICYSSGGLCYYRELFAIQY